MSSSKFDPLEEAKITDDNTSEEKGLSKKKQKKADKAAKKAAEAVAAETPPPPPPPTPEERAAFKPPVIKPAVEATMEVKPGKKYRILEDRMASVGGRMTKLRAGKVLEARYYGGPVGLQRILDSGVKVEEV